MTTPQGTRSLDTELVLVAEAVRDDTLTKLTQLVMPVVTQAFWLAGQAKLITDPEADDEWAPMARRTLDDLERVRDVIDALTDHLCREEPADAASAVEVDDLTARVARIERQMVTEVRQITDIVRDLRDGFGGES